MTRDFLRRCALWIGIPAAVMVLAAIFWMRYGPPYDLQAVGGSWYLGKTAPFDIIEAGTRFRSLYRKAGRRTVQVDTMVDKARFYTPDCVVYSALRDGRGPTFAVCGDRTPVRIMNFGDDWSIEADGLVFPAGRAYPGSTVDEPARLKPIATIIAFATRQPPYATDWRKSDSSLSHDQVDTVLRKP